MTQAPTPGPLSAENLARKTVETEEVFRLTLCGSTKFRAEYELWNKRLTLAGFLVYSVSGFGHSGDTFTEEEKARLDQIHLAKIDASHAIVVLNVGGYVGESTSREIAYAKAAGKPVYFLEGDNIIYRLRTGPDGANSLRYRAFDWGSLAPTAPVEASGSERDALHPDAQPFMHYPDLALHIERMAMSGVVGSGISWDAFLHELNKALRPQPSGETRESGPGGWLINSTDGVWEWTGVRMAAVAAITEGLPVWSVSRGEYEPVSARPLALGRVAQSVEPSAHNGLVAGSNPAATTSPLALGGQQGEEAAWSWLNRHVECDPADRDYSADEMVDAFMAGAGRYDIWLKALERIAGEQQHRSGYCQTDITVEPALTAEEAQTVARAALSTTPARAEALSDAPYAGITEEDRRSWPPEPWGGFPNAEWVESYERWHNRYGPAALARRAAKSARAEAQDEGAAGEPVVWPKTCDGIEQPAFEAWAKSERFDMHEHPLHYLFMDPKTDAARQGWKAGLNHAIERMKSAHPSPSPAADEDRVRIAVEALEVKINAPLTGPTHGAWDRGRIAGLEEALAALKSEGK